MTTRTWPYGTTRRGTVRIARMQNPFYAKTSDAQIIVDDQKEMHACVGESCADFTAKDGDTGTLTFTQGGPTGGYWKFTKDPA